MKHSFDTILYAVYISLETDSYLFLKVSFHAWKKLSFPHGLFVNMVRDGDWSLFSEKHPYCAALSQCWLLCWGGGLTRRAIVKPGIRTQCVNAVVCKIISI